MWNSRLHRLPNGAFGCAHITYLIGTAKRIGYNDVLAGLGPRSTYGIVERYENPVGVVCESKMFFVPFRASIFIRRGLRQRATLF